MEIGFRRRLAYRQARNTILVAFVLGLLVSFSQIGLDLLKERERIDSTISQILAMSERPATQAAYQLDGNLARNVVDGLIQYQAISEVRLVDNFGTVLAEYSRPKTKSRYDWLVSLVLGDELTYRVILPSVGADVSVGHMDVRADTHMLALSFIDRAGVTLIGGALRDGGLALVLTLIFYYTITRPLLRITRRLSQINPAKPDEGLVEVPAWHERDEMGLLARTVNGLLQGFGRSLARSQAAEKQVIEREVRLRGIMENVPDGILTINENGDIESANSAAAVIFGCPASTLIGRPFAGQVEDPERAFLNGVLEAYHLTKDASVFNEAPGQATVLRDDGSRAPVELRFNEMRLQDRRLIVCVAMDITDRIESERELKEMEEQLLQSQKMEAVGTLASGIAHDFNNLLQAMSGCTQLLSDTPTMDPAARAHLERIDGAIERAAELVQRLLTFSRKVKPQLKSLDLNHEISQAIGMLERVIPKMIRIETNLADGLKPVSGDPFQIEQVVMNLGVNARDAMPNGGCLRLETEDVVINEENRPPTGLPPGQYVRLRVSDNGLGIDRETAAHIFEPFFTTKGVGRGTGLGLSMVYGIVADHRGHISCQSEPGRGTSFDVLLPALAEIPAETDGASANPTVEPGGGETILVVDDERSIVEVARELLKRYGYRVLTAASGEEALEVYRRAGADLTILDLGMPGMGGLNCLKNLREFDPDVRVLVASGYQSEEWKEAARQAGAIGFIGKPYRLTALLVQVRAALDLPEPTGLDLAGSK